jgi:hypothetical protein
MLFNNSKRDLNKEVILLKNFIPQRLADDVEKAFVNTLMPWYTNGDVWGKEYLNLGDLTKKNSNVIDSIGFHHMIYYDRQKMSENFLLCNSILYCLEMQMGINITDILRIRARMTSQAKEHDSSKYCGPHVDFFDETDYYSFVYYVHDCDGDTFVFDETTETVKKNPKCLSNPKILNRFKPQKGSAIFFPGDIFHAGNCPIEDKMRIVLNYDIKIAKK